MFDGLSIIYSVFTVWEQKNMLQYYRGNSEKFDEWWLLGYFMAMTRIVAFFFSCLSGCAWCTVHFCIR